MLIASVSPATAQITLHPPARVHSMTAESVDAFANSANGAITFTRESVRSADIKVDAQGGLHVTFLSLGQTGNLTHKPVFYGYCPPNDAAGCTDPDGWTLVEVENDWQGTKLFLTSEDKPRLFLFDDRATVQNERATFYAYAECDLNCTSEAGWQVRVLGASRDGGNIDSDRRPVHRFALDGQGRPRFVYYFGSLWTSETQFEQPAYYVACDQNCATNGDWRAVRLPDSYLQGEIHDLENAALSFAPDGAPRLLFALQYPHNGNEFDLRDWLVYGECTAACDDPGDWAPPLGLVLLGSGPDDKSFSMRVDDSGRVHAAVKPIGEPLHYLWCDGGCSTGNWYGYALELADDDAEQPALVLDSDMNPRIAYKDADGGLGYAWCDHGCRTAAPSWSRKFVESEDVLMEAVPMPLPPGCIDHFWFGGFRSSLALDPGGNPRFAYDGEYLRRCYYNPQLPGHGHFIERLWWTSRIGMFNQPGSSTPNEPGPRDAERLSLGAAYPNPASTLSTFSFHMPEAGAVRLVVRDILGREVAVLADGTMPAGTHRVMFDASGLASGMYFVRLEAEGFAAVRPVTIAR